MAKKIKIIYVTAALEVGGAEMFLYDLVKHIDRQSFDVSVATVIGGGSLEPQFKALGAPVFVFGGRYSKLLGGIREACKLYHLFKKEKPDIVHTQLFPADLWGRIAAKLAGVPYIVTTEQNVNVDQNWLRETFKRWTYKLADRVVAISIAVRKYTQERYKVSAEKIEIIPNGIDFKKIENRKLKVESRNDRRVILTVGRLVLQKGQKYLLEAFSILKNREGLELWLAGEGDLRPELEKQARDLKIDSQVKFLGRRHDVPVLLAQADLFVFPSEWEGLGVAVLEAAATRVPMVATAVDGILDIVDPPPLQTPQLAAENKMGRILRSFSEGGKLAAEDERVFIAGDTSPACCEVVHKESAKLVPPKDSRALAEAIEFMLANPDKAKVLAERAYNQVKNNFDIKVVVKKYEDLYKKLMK